MIVLKPQLKPEFPWVYNNHLNFIEQVENSEGYCVGSQKQVLNVSRCYRFFCTNNIKSINKLFTWRDLRMVVLVATKDIVAGEEILSSYFTLLQA